MVGGSKPPVVSRAAWLANGEYHAVFRATQTTVVLSSCAAQVVVRDGSGTRSYVTALCAVEADLLHVAEALQLRNRYPPPPLSHPTYQPYVCRTLQPRGTAILKPTPNTNQPTTARWLGGTKCRDAGGFTTVTSSDGIAQLLLHPSRCAVTVSYPIPVLNPASDRTIAKYAPGVSSGVFLKPDSPSETEYTVQTETYPIHHLLPPALLSGDGAEVPPDVSATGCTALADYTPGNWSAQRELWSREYRPDDAGQPTRHDRQQPIPKGFRWVYPLAMALLTDLDSESDDGQTGRESAEGEDPHRLEAKGRWVSVGGVRVSERALRKYVQTQAFSTQLPRSAPLLGDEMSKVYPIPADASVYTAANLFRSFAANRGPSGLGVPVAVFERELACMFYADVALVLHDHSVITQNRAFDGAPPPPAQGAEEGGERDVVSKRCRIDYFTHHVPGGVPRFVHAGADRIVRLDGGKSEWSGLRQYYLRPIMAYVTGHADAASSAAGGAAAGCPPAQPALPSFPAGSHSLETRRYSLPDVGEVNIVGSRVSMRFPDRAIFRMDVNSTSASLLLPTGNEVTLPIDSPCIPDELRKYSDTALAVLQQIAETERQWLA
ncbi:hypothetical protein DIPPA_05677 [Diplonema papillatum]|nr:hypothetical protein DIPPA_05677 [Diplonema papillatum]|eukprot:gene19367-29824_t